MSLPARTSKSTKSCQLVRVVAKVWVSCHRPARATRICLLLAMIESCAENGKACYAGPYVHWDRLCAAPLRSLPNSAPQLLRPHDQLAQRANAQTEHRADG